MSHACICRTCLLSHFPHAQLSDFYTVRSFGRWVPREKHGVVAGSGNISTLLARGSVDKVRVALPPTFRGSHLYSACGAWLHHCPLREPRSLVHPMVLHPCALPLIHTCGLHNIRLALCMLPYADTSWPTRLTRLNRLNVCITTVRPYYYGSAGLGMGTRTIVTQKVARAQKIVHRWR